MLTPIVILKALFIVVKTGYFERWKGFGLEGVRWEIGALKCICFNTPIFICNFESRRSLKNDISCGTFLSENKSSNLSRLQDPCSSFRLP